MVLHDKIKNFVPNICMKVRLYIVYNSDRSIVHSIKVLCVLLLLSSIFGYSTAFPDYYIMPKWFFSLNCLFAMFFLVSIAVLQGINIDFCHLSNIFTYSAIVICTFQALYIIACFCGIFECKSIPYSGSFENVAGSASCLSFCFPLGFRKFKTFGNLVKQLFVISKIICITAVILSESRAGLLSITCYLFYFFFSKNQNKVLLLLTIPVIVLLFLFYLKHDSTRGRLIILFITIKMIIDQGLLCGINGGFDAQYMNCQANYFQNYPLSEYAILVGDIHHPLNEYIYFLANYGLIALILLILLIVFVISYSIKFNRKDGLDLFAIICFFSLYSYPFLYPFTWILLLYSICLIFYNKFVANKERIAILLLMFTSLASINCNIKLNNYVKWNQLRTKSISGNNNDIISQYKTIYQVLHSDSNFLFDYALTLFHCGSFNAAQNVIKECSTKKSSFKISLLSGDIQFAQGNTNMALKHYIDAEYMCPSRFEPIQRQVEIYKYTGDTIAFKTKKRIMMHKATKIGMVN